MRRQIITVLVVALFIMAVTVPFLFISVREAVATGTSQYENFNDYTKVDPNSHISVASSTHVDVDGLTRGEDAYLYLDKSAGHFDDFEHHIDIKPISGTSWGYGCPWALANSVDDLSGIKTGGGTAIALQFYRLGDTTRAIRLIEVYGSSQYAGSNIALTLTTQYYCLIRKVETNFTLRVWTSSTDRDNDDTGAGSYVGQSSYSLHADHELRYIYAVNSFNDADPTQTVTFDVDNFYLQELGGLQNFNFYDENDASGRYVKNSTYVTITGLDRTDADHYVVKNFDSGHFTDFEHLVDFYVDSSTDSNASYIVGGIWGLANAKDDMNYFWNNYHAFFMVINCRSQSGEYQLALRQCSATVGERINAFSAAHLSEDTWYYARIARSGTTFWAEIYSSDSNRASKSSIMENLTISPCVTTAYQYVYASSSGNFVTSRTMSGYVRNLNLQEANPYCIIDYDNVYAGQTCNFYFLWNDVNGLDMYRFDWKNGSASWSNGTWTSFGGSGTTQYANITKTLNYTVGATIQFVCYANDSTSVIGSSVLETFLTIGNWWNRVVEDARWSWNAVLDLTNTYSSYGNMTPIYSHELGVQDYLYPHMLGASLAMYKMTGNTTYLDYARYACNDMLTYAQNSTTKLIGPIFKANGTTDNSAIEGTSQFLLSVVHLAFENSSYVSTVNQLCNAIIVYLLNGNDVNPELPVLCYPNGVEATDDVRWRNETERIVECFLWAYKLTDNSTYLTKARNILVTWWQTRDQDGDPTTNLIPDAINTESTNLTNPASTWLEDFTRQYSAGSYLRLLCLYYFFDENATIYSIIDTYAQAICNHLWQTLEYHWKYRTFLDSGIGKDESMEGNWPSLGYSMLLAYDIVGNKTFWNLSLDDYDTCFQNEGYNFVNDLIIHGSNPSGVVTNESCMWFGFNTIVSEWNWLQSHGNTTIQGNNRMEALYEHTIRRHSISGTYRQGNYGYRRTIVAVGQGAYDNITQSDKDYHFNLATGSLLPWLQFAIQVSEGVNITWVTFPNKKLYQTWHGEDFMHNDHHAHWFENVTFNVAQNKIGFSEITGAGTVTFNATILAATRDGWAYFDYTSNNLSTTSGSHSYEVYFVSISQNTTLSTGWNNFTAWPADIGHTLAEVNISIYGDGINFTVLAKYNGTHYTFVWGYQVNADLTIASTSDTIFIYCTVGGTWTHDYP